MIAFHHDTLNTDYTTECTDSPNAPSVYNQWDSYGALDFTKHYVNKKYSRMQSLAIWRCR